MSSDCRQESVRCIVLSPYISCETITALYTWSFHFSGALHPFQNSFKLYAVVSALVNLVCNSADFRALSVIVPPRSIALSSDATVHRWRIRFSLCNSCLCGYIFLYLISCCTLRFLILLPSVSSLFLFLFSQ